MKLGGETKKFIEGEKFSNGYKMDIKDKNFARDRIEFLEITCKRKKVLHIGCVDHLELIEEKMKRGKWLHERISRVATLVWGVDINKEGIEYMRSKLGYPNIVHGDIVEKEK